MSIKNLVTFPMTSQWRHKVGYFAQFSIVLLKMARLLVVFSSVSIGRGRGQVLYFVRVKTDHNYVIYENIYLVHDLALY